MDLPVRLLHDFLLNSALLHPSKTAVAVDNISYSYRELHTMAAGLAGALKKEGLQRGDRVALYLDNSWACVVSIFGTLIAGGAFVLINPQTIAGKLKYILDDSEARFLITDIHLKGSFTDATMGSTFISAILLTGYEQDGTCGSIPVVPFEAFCKQGDSSGRFDSAIPLDLAALIYTSGTTGDPKGVMMTHQAMVFSAISVAQYLRLSAQDRILNVLPLAFDYGLYQLIMSVYLGATLILE